MNSLKLKYYQDPGHGWVAVKRTLISYLSLDSKISSCSYQKGNTVYLEEDQDLMFFMEECKKNGIEVLFESKHTNNSSPIRSYERYQKILK